MRIFSWFDQRGFKEYHIPLHVTRMVCLTGSARHEQAGRMIIFSHQFSPKGRVRGFHLLRYYGLTIIHYGFALK